MGFPVIRIFNANLDNPEHASAVVMLLNEYACDLMGGGQELSDFCKANLAAELRKRNTIHSLLAYVDDEPAGFSICIDGFSTFNCRPLLNIHDLAVCPRFRGKGIAKKLLTHIEELAQQLGCCKITLEVLEGNRIAHDLYLKSGFAQYELDRSMGGAILMQKKLLFE
jgi:ribosomal protein S18 acetylase RimI-like enzyme